MKSKYLIVIVFFVFSLACGSTANRENPTAYKNAQPTSVPQPTKTDSEGEAKSAGRSNPAAAQLSVDQAEKSKPVQTVTERKIIRNAEITLEAAAPEDVQQKVSAIVEGKGGFVIETQQSSSSAQIKTRDVVTMTVRVPAEKFNESLDEIRKTASRVIVETVKGQDVTEEFLDVEARLKTKKALEEQFLEIMKQGKTVEDALKVQRELANVRTEIEQIEGRKRFLENQSSLSTIKLIIQTPNSITPNSAGFFDKLGQSFSNGFDAALTFVLFLVTLIIAILPFLILVVLPIVLLIRYLVKKGKKQRLAREIVREQELREDIKNE